MFNTLTMQSIAKIIAHFYDDYGPSEKNNNL
jgi:hypothetical protein